MGIFNRKQSKTFDYSQEVYFDQYNLSFSDFINLLERPVPKAIEMAMKTITFVCTFRKINANHFIDFLNSVSKVVLSENTNLISTFKIRERINNTIHAYFDKNNIDSKDVVPYFYEDCFLFVCYVIKLQRT
jgi:hypothetical protein